MKRRVFGGGADEDDAAVFNYREKRILLRFVESVDFIEKQDGSSVALIFRFSRRFHRFSHVFHAARDGGERNESVGGGFGGRDDGFRD